MRRTNQLAISLVAGLLPLFPQSSAAAERMLVRTQAEYRQAVKALEPGDTVVLANGEWRDFQILFEGQGSEHQPIELTAEEKGKVVITGASNLRLAGEHLLVSGLVFRDGHSPTGEVIAFRKDSRTPANKSRVTEVVIDHFNNPVRQETDYWVAIHGQDNRFDHSHLVGKSNRGVTLAVVRDSDAEDRHRIDHNYFGPRPNLGSNGGETVRIGTSHQSRSNSRTVVEYNVFDRCDGEIEIVSNKSGGNVFRGNLFLESRGALVLRHGSGNLVEGNVFIGNGKPHTGGIRVINAGQTVRNNYMEGLAGTGFASAITVLNGVPNSPINRYDQVKSAIIEHNSVIESARIELAAGSDAERTAVPIDSRFAANLIVNASDDGIFRIEDDISGIMFADNVQTPVADPRIERGIIRRPVAVERAANGLLYPTDPTITAGVSRTLTPISKEDSGVAWYSKPAADAQARFGHGRKIAVAPGEGALAPAIEMAESGDTIVLGAGRHGVDRVLRIDRPLTLVGPEVASGRTPAAVIDFSRPTLFQIEDGGSLRIARIAISGRSAPDSAGNAVVRTSSHPMLENYVVLIEDSRIVDLDVNAAFDVIATSKGTVADRILIENSHFGNISGSVVAADAENDDLGLYNAERVEIRASEFHDVDGPIVDIYRGGTDESTFGPKFIMSNSLVNGSGRGARNAARASIILHGVQVAAIESNRFVDSGHVSVVHTVGTPATAIMGNRFVRTPAPVVTELVAKGEQRAIIRDNVMENGK